MPRTPSPEPSNAEQQRAAKLEMVEDTFRDFNHMVGLYERMADTSIKTNYDMVEVLDKMNDNVAAFLVKIKDIHPRLTA